MPNGRTWVIWPAAFSPLRPRATPAAMSDAPGSSRTDFHLGVAVAIVAALVAIVDLANGRFGDDELIATEEKVSAYLWFNAKGIKESVAESQRDLLGALVVTGVVAADRQGDVATIIAGNDAEVARFAREKAAILDGGVIDGQRVVGARALEARASRLDRVGNFLDVSMLFLHLSLLLGGVGIAVSHKELERTLLKIVVGGAALGMATAVIGLIDYAR